MLCYVIRNYRRILSLLPNQWKSTIWNAKLLYERVPSFAMAASREGVLSLLEEKQMLLELISGTVSQCCRCCEFES